MALPTPRRGCRLNHRQKLLLLQYAEEHPDILRTKLNSNFTPEDRLKLWEGVAKLLNCQGVGAIKSPHEWRKSWNDWKTNVRSKWQKIRSHSKVNGGGSPLRSNLNMEEEKLMDLIGWVRAENDKPIKLGIEKRVDAPGPSQLFPMILLQVVPADTPEVSNSSFENADTSNAGENNLQDKDLQTAIIPNDCGIFPMVVEKEKVPTDTSELETIVVKEEVPEETPELETVIVKERMPADTTGLEMIVVKEEVLSDAPEMPKSPFENADVPNMEEDNLQDMDLQTATNAQEKGRRRFRETAVERAASNFAQIQREQVEATRELKDAIQGLTQAVNTQAEAFTEVVQVLSSFLRNNNSHQ